MKWLRQYGWRVYNADSGGGDGSPATAEVPEQNVISIDDLERDMLAEDDEIQETPAPEGHPGETDTDTSEAAPEGHPAPEAEGVQEKQPYTPDELANLDPKQMDPERVPSEYKPWYNKYMEAQKGADRKINELTQQVQQSQNQQQTQQLPPDQQLLQAYMQDPNGVLADINARFKAAEIEGDILLQNKLLSLKTDLEIQANHVRSRQSEISRVINDTETATLQAIPDWPQKVEPVTNFIVNDFNVPMSLIQALTDPTKVGKDTVVIVRKFVNEVFDRLNAGKTAQTKVSTEPTQGERPSASPQATSTSSLSSKKRDMETAKAKATKSGDEDDWVKYYELQSEVAELERKP